MSNWLSVVKTRCGLKRNEIDMERQGAV